MEKKILDIGQIINLSEQSRIVYKNPSALKKHPQNNFPDVTGAKWASFKEGIKSLGVLHPVIIDNEDRILSGSQRTRACNELGIKVPTIKLKTRLDPEQARKIIVVLNLSREYSRSEFRKLWNEVYAEWAAEQLKAGVSIGKIASKINQQSGIKGNTSHRAVEKIANELILKRFKTLDQMPFSDNAKKTIRTLIRQCTISLEKIDSLTEEYREARSELAKIVRPQLFNLPEVTAQKREDEISETTGVKNLTFNKYRNG